MARSRNDGYSINLRWDRAFPSSYLYQIGYNIYYSTVENDVFTEGVKYLLIETGSYTDGYLDIDIPNLIAGELYYFAVRSFEYESDWYNLHLLPEIIDRLYVYPEALLLSDITDTDVIIPISDINSFPAYGVIQVGYELIRYSSKSIPTNSLIVADVNTDRGFQGTDVRMHQVDGYDGVVQCNPILRFFKGFEEENTVIQQETANFFYPNYAYTISDGYRTVNTDILTTDLSSVEANHTDFPAYDYAGWHRTDPTMLMDGTCLDTYIGGEFYCADDYLGVGRQVRRVPVNDQNSQRLELKLSVDGETCILIKRQRTGIRCSCFLPNTEYPEDRCGLCMGTGFVMSWDRYYNPRRSDGRIIIRFGATKEDLVSSSSGLESDFIPECWTLNVPIIKDRDVIVRYDEDGQREFYYEVLHVTRNKLFMNEYGGQTFAAQRIRKTDKFYQIPFIDSTAQVPQEITTSIGFLRGADDVPIPHTHIIKINETITSLIQINQLTSISSGHSHIVKDGIVENVLGHAHTVVI